ncbi:hypothetical protein QBC36DRAFT_328786 [Triangularia setosa]|uniref:Rad60/SUMO-like domain-containing protein n=1 Tax=Triangularia setosa TaxID=2587417 RepID=A0AAN6W758_9PEZI|nr:hypothetical protein QBC36DRAFT_328786 [Podospora setosa]
MARLPFKRKESQPKPASPVTLGSDDDDDGDALSLFRHSKEVFPEVIREAEEESRDRSNGRKRKSSPSEEDGNERGRRRRTSSLGQSSSPPRQKLTLDGSDDDDDIIMDVKGKGKEVVRPTKIVTPVKQRSAAVSATPVVVIGDNDNDNDALSTVTPARGKKPVKADLDSDDDSDIQEVDPFDKEESPNSHDDELQELIRKQREKLGRVKEDFIVHIFVSSPIPNTKPIVVRRKAKQDMVPIIPTWIKKQQELGLDFSSEELNLFVTWKHNKIYTPNNVASLNLEINEDGQIVFGQGDGYRAIKQGPALHMEVWDEANYKDFQRWKDKERSARYGLVDLGEAGDCDAESAPEEPKKKGIKVVLKAKDLEPLKMSVQEDNTVGNMIEAFRQRRDIGEEWHVSIWLEGDELEEDTLVKDADIDPDEPNQFEVHMKKQ